MTTAEAKAKDTSYQLNKAKCETCGWHFESDETDREWVVIVKGRYHGYEHPDHEVRLKQSIIDIDCERIYPPPTILDRL